jgi:hypothetical protein
LIWESDCISFAQGLLEQIIKDIRSLNHLTDLECHSYKESSSEGALTTPKALHHSQSMSNLNETLNSSTIYGSSVNLSKPTIALAASHARQSSEKRLISIANLKITGGNENGETMKAYRETIERYIKDHLVHSAKSTADLSNEGLKNHIREFFQEVA